MASPGGGAARKKSARRPGAGGGPTERTGEAPAARAEKPAGPREARTPAAEGEKRPVRKPVRQGPVAGQPEPGFKGRLDTFVRFLKSVRAEMKRVTWPSVKEARAATIVVVVTLLLISGYMGLVDLVLTKIFGTPVVSGY